MFPCRLGIQAKARHQGKPVWCLATRTDLLSRVRRSLRRKEPHYRTADSTPPIEALCCHLLFLDVGARIYEGSGKCYYPYSTPIHWRRVEVACNKSALSRHAFPRRICKISGMDLRYDIFEKFDDDSFLWRAAATGVQGAQDKLSELATTSAHEFFAVHLPTHDIIASVNVPKPPQN